MFCNNCGKEIVDGAKFCNYCGAQTNTQPRMAEPAQPVQPTQQQAAPVEEKKGGKRFLSILIAVAVFFVVRYATENIFFGKKSTANTSTGSSGVIEISRPNPLSTCYYGALYQDGYLTYGSARVALNGFKLLPSGEGENDWLMSADDTLLVGVNKTLEVGVSYDASDADGILKSYSGSSFTNMQMVDFRKYEQNGYPVIRYVMSCNEDGLDEYIGELIILPEKTANESMRITVCSLAESGIGPINEVFDSLSISSAYNLKSGDTTDMGVQQITVK